MSKAISPPWSARWDFCGFHEFCDRFFYWGQVLAGILGSIVTLPYGPEGKHGANYMQTMAASVAGMCGLRVLIQAHRRCTTTGSRDLQTGEILFIQISRYPRPTLYQQSFLGHVANMFAAAEHINRRRSSNWRRNCSEATCPPLCSVVAAHHSVAQRCEGRAAAVAAVKSHRARCYRRARSTHRRRARRWLRAISRSA
jgi:hypothetical protein